MPPAPCNVPLRSEPATNVTINSQTALIYPDGFFYKYGLTLTNGTNSVTANAQDSYGPRNVRAYQSGFHGQRPEPACGPYALGFIGLELDPATSNRFVR
jgi:hypothetical protein